METQPATNGKPAVDGVAGAFKFRTFKDDSSSLAVTVPQMGNNGSLHQKEQMNIDSEAGLIGTIVFPKGEVMTWSQLGDI